MKLQLTPRLWSIAKDYDLGVLQRMMMLREQKQNQMNLTITTVRKAYGDEQEHTTT